MKTLFPIQETSKQALLRSLHNHGAALDSSDVGTGKTVKAVELARNLGLPVLVICPKIVIPVWKKAFEEQGLPIPEVINYEKLRTGKHPIVSKKHKKVFTWNLPTPYLIIWDEAHKCKGETSVNAALLMTAKEQGHHCLMLSATAAKNPSDLRAIGYCLGLHDGRSFRAWALRNGCKIDPWHKLYFPVKSRPFLTKLNAEIYPSRAHKITRDDMKEFFSQTSIMAEPLCLGNEKEISRLYEEMEEELALIEQMQGSDKGASQLTARLRARQAVEALKVPAIVSMVEDYVESGMSVAIFVNFKATIGAVSERLTMEHTRIEGVNSEKERQERQESIEAFQEDRIRVVLCNIAAGGTGLSLHDTRGEFPRVAIISPNDSAEEIAQVIGRIDRAGAKTDTLQRVLFAADTVEEEVAKNFRKKLADMDLLHAVRPK